MTQRHGSWPAGPWLGVAAELLVAAEQPSKPDEAPVDASATSGTDRLDAPNCSTKALVL